MGMIGGDGGHYSSFHSTSSFGSNHNNNNNANIKKGARSLSVQPEGMGRVYERGKAPAPPPPGTSQQPLSSPHTLPNGLINGPSPSDVSSKPKAVLINGPSPSDVSSKPKAVVVYNYVKKDNQEMSLGKSQIVTVLDSKKGSEWWKVQDSIGRQGFYPSHYLKMI